ncbi:MAG: alanine dehydrogenase [Anaerolineales bacterium]|jgi:alanine dehydrogenase|nr:alanine dehydrogenase [Anaerolineales bacterium]
MNIGIPKERRPFEYRVGISPAGVEILVQQGHTVHLEHEAGLGSGFSDQEYERAGAGVVYSGHEVYGRSDLLLKVTRPVEEEIEWFNSGSILMGFLHLASARQGRVEGLIQKKITAIAYEQIQFPDGSLPVLHSLSQIGGLLAPQIAARFMQNNLGGKGILLGGVAGVPPAEIVIIGAGAAGTAAAQSFLGLGAHVTVLDKSMEPLQRIHERYPQLVTMISTRRNIERACNYADVVLGVVLVPGERAPIVISREMLKTMKPRSLLIDMSIDQGGCFESSRPTTHDHPTYVEEGILHYCVPNVSAVVARTSTHAFVNAAMPYIMKVAGSGVEAAVGQDPALELGLNLVEGEIRHLQRWIAPEEGD